jgi:hypothetical protein
MEAAMESIGIDVHKVNSQICVVGENAEVLEERRIQTDRERFAAVLGGEGGRQLRWPCAVDSPVGRS